MLGWLNTTRLHFIGIGGIGMSGIAEVLLDLGYKISGSDLHASSVTEKLQSKGAVIYIGHSSENVDGSDIVVYSSAIDSSNPECKRAAELHIPMIKRAEMLAELMRLKFGIAIAGSHGKTTTTSIVATVFQEAKMDATHIIGGIVSNLGGNAKKGNGKYIIAEADESDGSFLQLNPIMAAVTNIDDDHLDHYGSRERIVEAFVDFVNKVPFYGRIVLNGQDSKSVGVRDKIKRPVVWIGIDGDFDYSAMDASYSATGTEFNLKYAGVSVGDFKTHLVGMHNLYNTLMAVALCYEAGIDWETIKKGLLKFSGVGRRLEKIYEKGDLVVIDDYGHHPTEIQSTIRALKLVDKRRLTVIFEPHRFTRTQNFWKEFQESFKGADEVYISPIYPASELPIKGITSENLVEEMNRLGIKASYVSSLEEMKSIFKRSANSSEIILTLGAGAISKRARDLVKEI